MWSSYSGTEVASRLMSTAKMFPRDASTGIYLVDNVVDIAFHFLPCTNCTLYNCTITAVANSKMSPNARYTLMSMLVLMFITCLPCYYFLRRLQRFLYAKGIGPFRHFGQCALVGELGPG